MTQANDKPESRNDEGKEKLESGEVTSIDEFDNNPNTNPSHPFNLYESLVRGTR